MVPPVTCRSPPVATYLSPAVPGPEDPPWSLRSRHVTSNPRLEDEPLLPLRTRLDLHPEDLLVRIHQAVSDLNRQVERQRLHLHRQRHVM